MRKLTFLLGAFVAFTAAPLTAQDIETPPDTADQIEAPADEMETPADETDTPADEMNAAAEQGAAEEPAQAAAPEHDWEFALSPTEKAANASGTVKVVEGDEASTYTIEISGLPAVDSLDQENRDVSSYTLWIVPSKDKVKESTLAGVLDVDAEGTGTFEGSTPLETFGIIVTATPDGAPETISGVPVLTGIPVRNDQPAAEEGAMEGDEPGAMEGEEETPATPDTPAPETPDTPAPETPETPAPEAPETPPGG